MRKVFFVLVSALMMSAAMPLKGQQVSPVAPDREDATVHRAQIPMAVVGNKWNILVRSGMTGMPDEMLDMTTCEYKAEALVHLNGKEYVSIVGTPSSPSTPVVYLREDMETGIVYRGLDDGEELFMFDYNFKKGDTFDTFSGITYEAGEFIYTVSDIEEKEIAGMMRRVYTIHVLFADAPDYVFAQYHWIEGIGCSVGFHLLPANLDGAFPQELICFEDTEGHQYVKFPDQGCFIYQNTLNAVATADQVQVYADAGAICVVCPPKTTSNTVKVYTIGGRLIRQVVSSSSKVVISLPKEYAQSQEGLIVNVNNKYNTKVSLK